MTTTTVLATFGNLMSPDLLFIGLLVLLLFGAKKLPELARGLGQSLNEFKKAREDFEHEITQPASPAPKDTLPRGDSGLSAEQLQSKVEELERQLQASQARQTPQLVSSTPISAEVVQEPIEQSKP